MKFIPQIGDNAEYNKILNIINIRLSETYK